ncbi:MAG TPA: PHP domain-containing protein [Roseiflexaceae bacterium]|nr:PHP domain-containing protein [Roseiflexaceae bacterium]
MDADWSKADLHIHTTYSDGTASVEAVLKHVAMHTDLRVIAITDHDTIAGALEARRLAPAYGIEAIVGEEVSTREGHLLALFIEEPLPPYQPAAATIAAVHAQGGLCIAPHPYDWMTPSLGRAGMRKRSAGAGCEWPLDGVESFNAGLWSLSANARAADVGEQLGLPLLGGSDAHHPATIGLGYTSFPGYTAADLRDAIRTHSIQPGGTAWRWLHGAEFVGLWLRERALRALLPSAS